MNLLYSTKEFKFPSNQKVTGDFPIVEDIDIPENNQRVIDVEYKICKRQEGASTINIGDAISRFQVSVTQCGNLQIFLPLRFNVKSMFANWQS